MKHYYLKENRIWMANEKMPTYDDEKNRYSYDTLCVIWHKQLQPCEISESELDKVKVWLYEHTKYSFKEPIDVTDIVDYYITCDCKCDSKTDECKGNEVIKYKFKQPSDNNGVVTFKECQCLKCSPIEFPNFRFNVCSICGNKRCPHASDHNYKCTNSNEVGQIGSVYREQSKKVDSDFNYTKSNFKKAFDLVEAIRCKQPKQVNSDETESLKLDILQILQEEANTQYNPEGKDSRVICSDDFDTVANRIINLFKTQK